jgi:3',5'-cyclic AMP phosphodiesterase CpdA
MANPATLRVIQISDTHLADEPSFFLENWAKLVTHVKARAPDLVIHTGDVSFDGANEEDQLRRASERLKDLECEVLAVPGNHDVGELPGPATRLEPAVSRASCDRFAQYFGQSRFQRDLGDWRLVGCNAMLFGSAIDAEAEEWEHLEEAIASAGKRRVALFLHKPLYREGPDDGSTPPGMVATAAAQRLHTLARNSKLELIASGHLHEHRIEPIDGVRHVWAPSTGFVTDEILSPPVGTRRVGFVDYLFRNDGVEVEVVCPDDMVTHLFMDHPDMYPRFQEAARRAVAGKLLERQAAR